MLPDTSLLMLQGRAGTWNLRCGLGPRGPLRPADRGPGAAGPGHHRHGCGLRPRRSAACRSGPAAGPITSSILTGPQHRALGAQPVVSIGDGRPVAAVALEPSFRAATGEEIGAAAVSGQRIPPRLLARLDSHHPGPRPGPGPPHGRHRTARDGDARHRRRQPRRPHRAPAYGPRLPGRGGGPPASARAHPRRLPTAARPSSACPPPGMPGSACTSTCRRATSRPCAAASSCRWAASRSRPACSRQAPPAPTSPAASSAAWPWAPCRWW